MLLQGPKRTFSSSERPVPAVFSSIHRQPFTAHVSRIKVRRAALCLAFSLSLAYSAWSSGWADQALSMPELPRMTFGSLPPTVRTVVQEAYDAVVAHPQDALANGKLGMVLHAHNLLEEAEVCYQRAHWLDPKSFRWTYYLGLVQTNQAKCNEAVESLRQALRLDADYFPAQLRLAQCLLVSHSYEEARKLYAAVLRKHPNDAEAHYGLGRVHAAHSDYTRAIESFRKACELFPKFAAAHHALARAYQRLGKNDQAQEALTLSKKSEGALPEIEDRLLAELQVLYRDFNAYVKLAEELGGKGKLEDAAAAYEEALAINPQLPEAHTRLIYLYGRLGQAERADEHYRATVRLDPKKPEVYFYYGALVMGQGKSREAEQAFRKALEINPHHAEAHNNLGYLLEGQGKVSEAIAEFQKALQTRPDFPQAHFSLGRILVKQENYEEGIPHLLKALSTGDEEKKASYLHALGIAYADVGDLVNASRYMRLARDKAAARHQSELLENINDDLRLLAGERSSQ